VKRCKWCAEEKPIEAFYRDAACADGHRPECKACTSARRKRWYAKNRDREIERVTAWQRENADQYTARQREYRAAGRRDYRAEHLRQTFGLTRSDYDAMLDRQNGGCAICGEPPADNRSLHIDHDHESGTVRGLLCFRCNAGVGQFADDPERLVRAAAYLEADDELTNLAKDRARALRVG
jgi:hypothetical protein